jgi:hypothetical protein
MSECNTCAVTHDITQEVAEIEVTEVKVKKGKVVPVLY